MKYTIVTTIVASIIFFEAFAQKSSETTMFESICKNVVSQNNYYLIKKNLKGVHVVADPVSGSQYIKFDDGVDKQRIAEFNKFTKEEQFKILQSERVPLYPLKDTTFIVDSYNLFSDEMSFLEGHFFFKVVRKVNSPNNKKVFLPIYAIGVRKNDLIISLMYNQYLSNFYFNLNASNINVYKTSTMKMESSNE